MNDNQPSQHCRPFTLTDERAKEISARFIADLKNEGLTASEVLDFLEQVKSNLKAKSWYFDALRR